MILSAVERAYQKMKYPIPESQVAFTWKRLKASSRFESGEVDLRYRGLRDNDLPVFSHAGGDSDSVFEYVRCDNLQPGKVEIGSKTFIESGNSRDVQLEMRTRLGGSESLILGKVEWTREGKVGIDQSWYIGQLLFKKGSSYEPIEMKLNIQKQPSRVKVATD